jgi:hypothetical protein
MMTKSGNVPVLGSTATCGAGRSPGPSFAPRLEARSSFFSRKISCCTLFLLFLYFFRSAFSVAERSPWLKRRSSCFRALICCRFSDPCRRAFLFGFSATPARCPVPGGASPPCAARKRAARKRAARIARFAPRAAREAWLKRKMGKRRLPPYGSYSPGNAHTALIIAVGPLNTIRTKSAERPRGRRPERAWRHPEARRRLSTGPWPEYRKPASKSNIVPVLVSLTVLHNVFEIPIIWRVRL